MSAFVWISMAVPLQERVFYITGEGGRQSLKTQARDRMGLIAPVSLFRNSKAMVENGNYKGVLRFLSS